MCVFQNTAFLCIGKDLLVCVCVHVKMMSFWAGVQCRGERETKGQATFTRMCFYTGNTHLCFSISVRRKKREMENRVVFFLTRESFLNLSLNSACLTPK